MYTTLVNAATVNQYINEPSWVIVDCRYDLTDSDAGYRNYLESHIPNAVYADLNHDLSGPPLTDHGRHPLPSPERMNNLFSTLGISHGAQVVAYDAAFGSLAARLWWMLRYMSHDRVCILDGGWQSWIQAGFAIEAGERKNPAESFSGLPCLDRLVTVDDVLSSTLLVDAREPARYDGRQEPIDPVAGHIPGAINHYWKNNLDDNGRFLPAARLKDMYLDLYGDRSPDGAVFYCGSGVTACHDILAAVHAGFPCPRLYAGSWSEWCADPERPVAGSQAKIP